MLKKLLKYDLEWCYKPLLVYGIYNLGIYFIGNKLLNKGVNVD